MDILIRRTINFLMITLVINAGGWTFNKEALADVWFDEQRSMALDIDHSPAASDGVQTTSPESPCNHWCHAAGHFMGLLNLRVPVMPEFAQGYSVQLSPIIQSSFPDGNFRPPRLLS
jgi:hypothetical protein